MLRGSVTELEPHGVGLSLFWTFEALDDKSLEANYEKVCTECWSRRDLKDRSQSRKIKDPLRNPVWLLKTSSEVGTVVINNIKNNVKNGF